MSRYNPNIEMQQLVKPKPKAKKGSVGKQSSKKGLLSNVKKTASINKHYVIAGLLLLGLAVVGGVVGGLFGGGVFDSSSSDEDSALSSTGVPSGTSSSSTGPAADPNLIVDLRLQTNLQNSVGGTTPTYGNNSWPQGCAPSFQATSLPNGQTATAYYNPCDSWNQHIDTKVTMTSSFTVMQWVKVNSVSVRHIMFCTTRPTTPTGWDPSSNIQPILYTTNSDVALGWQRYGVEATKTGVLTSAWQHYTSVYDSNTQMFTLYLNGANPVTSALAASDWATYTKPTLQIGGTTGNGNNLPLQGFIWRARAYNRALTQSEVTSQYNADLA